MSTPSGEQEYWITRHPPSSWLGLGWNEESIYVSVKGYSTQDPASLYRITLQVLQHAQFAIPEGIAQIPNILLTTESKVYMEDVLPLFGWASVAYCCYRYWPERLAGPDTQGKALDREAITVDSSGRLHLTVECYERNLNDPSHINKEAIFERIDDCFRQLGVTVRASVEESRQFALKDGLLHCTFSVQSEDIPKLVESVGSLPPLFSYKAMMGLYLQWLAGQPMCEKKSVSLLRSGKILIHRAPSVLAVDLDCRVYTLPELQKALEAKHAMRNTLKAIANRVLPTQSDHPEQYLGKPPTEAMLQRNYFLETHPKAGCQVLSHLINMCLCDETYCLMILRIFMGSKKDNGVKQGPLFPLVIIHSMVLAFRVPPNVLTAFHDKCPSQCLDTQVPLLTKFDSSKVVPSILFGPKQSSDLRGSLDYSYTNSVDPIRMI